MSSTVVVWIGVALAALIIVLTRLRLKGDGGAGRLRVSQALVTWHSVAGVISLVLWTTFLVGPDDSFAGGALMGILALAAWWATALCGLLILMRWLPARGRHVSRAVTDSWSDGPGLSILAHVGMLILVLFFTWAYLTAAV